MSSFYGGKQGRTYHIVARYDCVDLNNYAGTDDFEDFNTGVSYTEAKGKKFQYNNEFYVVLVDNISGIDDLTNEEKTYHVRGMVQQFAKGGAYTEANYGEYVLIDTIFNLNHKSDLQNGLLYRRGFDYNEDPNLNPKPNINEKDENDNFIYYDKNNHLKKDLWQAAWDAWVQKPGAGAIYVGQIVGPQGESPELTPVKWEDLNSKAGKKVIVPSSITRGDNNDQVTDSEGNIIYNDKGNPIWVGDAIKVGSYTVRDSDNNIIGAEIAFDIPQTIFDPPNVNLNGATYQGSSEEDSSSEDHPFYYKWHLYIPQVTDFNLELGSQIGQSIDGQGIQVQEDDEYITYKVHNVYENGERKIIEHLGRWPYRVINDITLLDNERTFITLSSDTIAQVGDLYNFQVISSRGNLICAVCIQSGQADFTYPPEIKQEGSSEGCEIGYKPNGESQQYRISWESNSGDSVWRVVEIPSTAPANSIEIDYKAGENTLFTNKLRNVDYLTIDATGKIYIKYSDSDSQYYLTSINGIKQIYLDDAGLNITYIDGRSPDFFEIKQINSIELQNQNNIESSQIFVANYKDGSIQNVSNNLNSILAIEMQGDNIVALYSDPDYRNNFKENKEENKDWFLRPWTDPNLYPNNSKIIYDLEEDEDSYIDQNNVTHYHKLVWINLTSPKGSYHVQGEYTYDDLKGIGTIDLSKGFGEISDLRDRTGWLVTVQDGSTKRIYAYDYNDISDNPSYLGKYTLPDGTATHWYEIFSLAASSIEPELSVVIEDVTNPPTSKLNTNGLWFVTYPGHDGNTTRTAIVGTAIVGQDVVG